MAKSKSRPTDGELQILAVLWRQGPSTVRAVHEALGKQTGYTTVLKLLQIMIEKGLVRRDKSQRTHVYQAKASADHTQRQLVKDLIQRAFDGSSTLLILHALDVTRPTPQEAAEIRRVLDTDEPGQG